MRASRVESKGGSESCQVYQSTGARHTPFPFPLSMVAVAVTHTSLAPSWVEVLSPRQHPVNTSLAPSFPPPPSPP